MIYPFDKVFRTVKRIALHLRRSALSIFSIPLLTTVPLLLSFNVNAYVSEDGTSDNLVVVVSTNNSTSSLSKKDVIDIYMGRFNTFPNGDKAEPIDLSEGSAEKRVFYEQLVGKSERKVKAYWSRLLFSGRASPPLQANSPNEVKALLNESANAIAYIPQSDVTPEMKIVYQLNK
uniref:hypothetical protein n=1 Tax=Ningiella ruwaisensis TaxID=2364274 RepID=UPI001F4F75CF|nr:hypothetical protein [Ningiella ruwaisensis]